jgi:AcrR family transcriptional regulator
MDAAERRALVLEIALQEFARGGLAGTSTEVIARQAGISHPYLFRLFPTKKALFIATVDLGFTRITERLQARVGTQHGPDALWAMGEAYDTILQRERDLLLFQLHAYAACGDEDVAKATRQAYERLWNFVAEVSAVDHAELTQFFAKGMLMNVIAATGLDDPTGCMHPLILPE